MEEVVDNEVTAIDDIDSTRLQVKESRLSLKPGGSSMLELQDMAIPGDINDQERTPDLFSDVLDGKNTGRIGTSEQACSSPRCMDNTGVMVEELTIKNYNSGKLTLMAASSMREKEQNKENNWQHLYQRAGGIGTMNMFGDVAYRDSSGPMPSVWEDAGSSFFSEFLDKKQQNENHNDTVEHSPHDEKQPAPCDTLLSPGGIRTKILSKSGFSEYFVKNTLKGKGIICRGPAHDRLGVHIRGQNFPKASPVDSNLALGLSRDIVNPANGITEIRPSVSPNPYKDGVSLREWLKAGSNKLDKSQNLYIFKQVLDLVDSLHSRGVALQALRPSSFKLLPSNQVIYMGSPVQKGLVENGRDKEFYHSDNDGEEKKPLEQGVLLGASQYSKKRKHGDNKSSSRRWPLFPTRSGINYGTAHDINAGSGCPRDTGYGFNEENSPKRENTTHGMSSSLYVSNTSLMRSTYGSDHLEEQWYASPEDLAERCCTLSSNIYSLGVLLYELLGSFGSARELAVAMMDLRQRILSPSFLSENPKEAGFCLWLLHPEPSLRPTTREILQSKLISEIRDLSMDELTSSIDREDADSELLLHFLESLEEQKQKGATKLVEDIKCLESDIAEVEMRRTNRSSAFSNRHKNSLESRGNSLIQEYYPPFGVNRKSSLLSSVSDTRLMNNMIQLESAYFSVRSSIQVSDGDIAEPGNHDVLRSRENYHGVQKVEAENKPLDRLGVFFDGLCKYARYSKFEVRGILRNGDFNSSANVICSLGFDRDEDYFATAGVSKKIKIYDFHAIMDDSVDIHYPAVEMSNKSKLSCICWNSYIRNYLAATDYDGVVKLWDAGSGQTVSQHIEHERRAWSVDFSRVDPTKLASGSDDCSVKLWSINEKNSLSTIRNIANICCVQFSPYSSHLLSFGSADYRTYCYDLRNVSTPLCILAGHDKAVSYVKFLDSETLVSASTDNTLKLWDLKKTSFGGFSTSSCTLTFKGHTNEKNFVGLSVADGYIACGSETNEVFAYYRSLPMPITSHKFGSLDPISGKETENDNNQFVSSVCWRQKSDMVVSANSSGCLKLLQMV